MRCCHSSDGGDDDEQVRDVGDAVHEVGRDARQVLVREVARREHVHREHGLQQTILPNVGTYN